MVGHASFLTASHKGPFIPNQVRGAGGIWTGGGGGGMKKNMALKSGGGDF